jgi:hypothetical protein
VGSTVRRPTGPWTPAVHSLLHFLEASGFEEAPRAIGVDDRGREILSFVDGDTVGDGEVWPSWTRSDETLVQAAQLLRRYHHVVAGFRPERGAIWRFASDGPRAGQIVCHNDVAPYNVVWRDGRIVGLIDWDVAGPGVPTSDLAFAAWAWVPLHDPSLLADHGWGRPPDAGARLRLLCDAYGLEDRSGFAARIPERIEVSIDRIERGADAGDMGLRALRDRGYLDAVRTTLAHVGGRVDELQSAIDR